MMDETWDRSKVFDLSPPLHPPDFMWTKGNEYDPENEKAVTREHYNKVVGILGGGDGHSTLLNMEKHLSEHLSTAENKGAYWESRRNYARLQHIGTRQKIVSISRKVVSEELSSGHSGRITDELDRVYRKILNKPIGEHWRAKGGGFKLSLPEQETWSAWCSGGFLSENDVQKGVDITLSDLSIRYRPIKSQKLCNRRSARSSI